MGIAESSRRQICADIFGQQVRSHLEEGIIDADDEDEFDVRLGQLEDVWEQREGIKEGISTDSSCDVKPMSSKGTY